MNRKDALVAWNTEKNSLGITVNNLSLETVGQPSEKVFTTAALVKEAKETQKDESAYQVAMQKIRKKSGKIVADFPTLPYMPVGSMRPEKGEATPSFKAVADLGFTPSLVDEADAEELGLAGLVHEDEGIPAKSQELPGLAPSLALEQSPQVALIQTGGGSKGIAAKDQYASNLSEDSPSLALEQSPQVALTQGDVDEEIALAKGEPAEDQVAVVETEASVAQPMHQEKEESVQTAMIKAIEGIVPERSSYGLVAYKTFDEAQRMVDKIRDGVVGDKTGDWDFAIDKVGKVYQIQTQGGATMTDKHKAAFFDKLASEYPGEMGNLEAGVKDKDFVQRIPAKKYRKKGK
jgi:hypothetical protein